MAAKLPTYRDLGALPSARSGRIIASYDTSAIGRGMEQYGSGIQQAANALYDSKKRSGLSELAALSEPTQAEKFEINRRFLEFVAGQDQSYTESLQSVEPGAVGFKEQTQKNYTDAAKAFFSTVPDSLKPQYDAKLFIAEDSLTTKAGAFETTERKRHFGDQLNTGLGTLENNLYANPDNFDKNLSEGNTFIDNVPDETLSRIEKDDLKKQWRRKAQLAALNGVTPEERLRLLGAGQDVTPQGATPTTARLSHSTYTRAQQVSDFFAKNYGLSSVAAAAIAGHAVQESGAQSAGKSGDAGSAHGVFQWRGDRFAALKKFAASRNADWRDMSTQLDFAAWEGQNGDAGARRAWAELQSATTIEEAVAAWMHFERPQGYKPGNPSGGHGYANRLAAARRILGGEGGSDFTPIEAGSGTGTFDPDRADPRFADMNYADADKIIQDTISDVNKQQNVVAAETKNKYDLDIVTNPESVTVEDILNDERIDDGEKAALIKTLNKAMEDFTKKREAVDDVRNGVAGNPFSEDDRKKANDAFNELSALPDTNPQIVAEYITERTGVVPGDYINSIRNSLNGTNVSEIADALQMAQRLKSTNRAALDGAPGSGDVIAAASDFERLTLDQGYTPEQAAQRYMDNRDRVKTLGYETLLKEGRELAKNIDNGDIQSALGYGFFSRNVTGAPEVGFDQARNAAIIGDAKEIFIEEYTNTGDGELAKSRMEDRMRKLYGVSSSFLDAEVITKYPPENFYPPVGGTHDYLRGQVADDVEALTGNKYPDTSVYLMSDVQTAKDIAAGQPPRYQIWYVDEKGELARAGATDDYFTPDVTRAQNELRTEIVQRRTTREGAIVEGEATDTNPLLGRDMQLQAVREAARKGLVTSAEKQNIETQIEDAFKEVTTKDAAKAAQEEEVRRKKQEMIDRMLKGLENEGFAR